MKQISKAESRQAELSSTVTEQERANNGEVSQQNWKTIIETYAPQWSAEIITQNPRVFYTTTPPFAGNM